MQQLWFINKPLTQHVSGTIVPIFRSGRPYTTAYGFQHLMCWLETPASTFSQVISLYCLYN